MKEARVHNYRKGCDNVGDTVARAIMGCGNAGRHSAEAIMGCGDAGRHSAEAIMGCGDAGRHSAEAIMGDRVEKEDIPLGSEVLGRPCLGDTNHKKAPSLLTTRVYGKQIINTR